MRRLISSIRFRSPVDSLTMVKLSISPNIDTKSSGFMSTPLVAGLLYAINGISIAAATEA
ncbi:Uncharacterised protein [Mycobacteroides abscessus subsp. abscessus]|nr:Uncharacterised protein [Mycobacteroides abscessus subsp. abscessus]